jgi:hypothetical protein
MKVESLAPLFLVSNISEHAIVRTDEVSYMELDKNSISFTLKNKKIIKWTFGKQSDARNEFYTIKTNINKSLI